MSRERVILQGGSRGRRKNIVMGLIPAKLTATAIFRVFMGSAWTML